MLSVTCIDKMWFSFLGVVLHLLWRDDFHNSPTVYLKLWTIMALHIKRNITGGKASKVTSGTCIFQKEEIFLLQYWNLFYEFSHLSNYIEFGSSNMQDSGNTKMMGAYLFWETLNLLILLGTSQELDIPISAHHSTPSAAHLCSGGLRWADGKLLKISH